MELNDEWTSNDEAFTMKARFHTEANVELNSFSATLQRDERKMRFAVEGPKGR
ncbi:MAG: hypothetical protein ACQESR_04470 [Planctomycetota bacterium]